MKSPDRIYTQQNIDLEISRALKYYSKTSFPSPNTRKQILMRAALPIRETHTQTKSFFQFLKEQLKSSDENLSHYGHWQFGIRNQHLTLAFCFSTSWRMGI
jgi:hypothetical protein